MITVAEDGADEKFVDAVDSDEEAAKPVEEVEGEEKEKVAVKAPVKSDGIYDGMKREPLYSDASMSCLWELVCLL